MRNNIYKNFCYIKKSFLKPTTFLLSVGFTKTSRHFAFIYCTLKNSIWFRLLNYFEISNCFTVKVKFYFQKGNVSLYYRICINRLIRKQVLCGVYTIMISIKWSYHYVRYINLFWYNGIIFNYILWSLSFLSMKIIIITLFKYMIWPFRIIHSIDSSSVTGYFLTYIISKQYL